MTCVYFIEVAALFAATNDYAIKFLSLLKSLLFLKNKSVNNSLALAMKAKKSGFFMMVIFNI